MKERKVLVVLVVVVGLLVVMILGSFLVTQVAADSLPGDLLYPVKRFTESVQLAITPSKEGKVKLHLRFGQERLREVELLTRQVGKVDSEVLRETQEFEELREKNQQLREELH